jgi:hypothetical protein
MSIDNELIDHLHKTFYTLPCWVFHRYHRPGGGSINNGTKNNNGPPFTQNS